jgi:hypothetical protein
MSISQENFYRLIKPYDSNLLHVSSTMMGGASKCYKELKKVSPSANKFSIINTKSNQLYEFDINNNLQMGGGGLPGTVASLSEIELLKRRIDSLEKRIIKLEDDQNKDNGNNNEQQNEGNGTNANVLGTNNNEIGVSLMGMPKTLPPQRPQLMPPMMQSTHQPNQLQHMSSMMQPSQQMQPMNQMNQMNQMQQINQMNQLNQSQRQQTGFNQELARKFI